MNETPVALTIAGSDPSGGAGIQGDLKTFHEWGVYGEAAVTLITVQNSSSFDRVEVLNPELVVQQIRAVLSDIPPQAVKTGALGNAAVVEEVAYIAGDLNCPLVIDPVIVSSFGTPLLSMDAIQIFKDRLLPRASLLTPNLQEAELLTGLDVQTVEGMRVAAQALIDAGAGSVLVKGGHLDGPATDLLLHEGEYFTFTCNRIDTSNTHGTGCAYSAAITAALALGDDIPTAVRKAKFYVYNAIATNPGLGHGSGPINHHALVARA